METRELLSPFIFHKTFLIKKCRVTVKRIIGLWMFYMLCVGLSPISIEASDPEILKPRVPVNEIDTAKTWINPFSPSPENLKKGKAFYHGKAFCVTCHGKDGKGFDHIPGLHGKLPRNFTDKLWQSTRTDGELMWVLKNGSPGTEMVSFIPTILTEKEAWHVILYVRSFSN